ncbi:MAG: sigma-54-dependent Fis family transcriptional regulator [Deltaproteobacteria bacterium]|nr:sigma-54-dependent Fis family transcriptional regulator [Deltaproteobacteria bacterium]
MGLKVLVIDDEPGFLQMLHVILSRAGYKATTVTSAEEALDLVEHKEYDLCLCDMKMPGMSGTEFLSELKTRGIQITVIVMSAYGSHEAAIAAMQQGAYDYISKPFQSDEIILTLRKAEEREQLRRENRELKSRVAKDTNSSPLVFKSDGMQKVIDTVKRIAAYRTTVLITGESGTGKELVASLIHNSSPRRSNPFTPVNCGAIPEGLMESEFFGHVKGAFTDAHGNKRGLIESSHGGTLFLDEIGELSQQLQVKLLRFLQEGEIRRVGDTRSRKFDVRVVAATARDLAAEVKADHFREDLFYRLNVVPIRIPPLVERLEDIPMLVDHFLKRTRERLAINRSISIGAEAMKLLMSYHWPGNVRELENAIERAVVLTEKPEIGPDVLPEAIREGDDGGGPSSKLNLSGLSIKRNRRSMEKTLIIRALEASGGNRTHAARHLEISHRALLYKLKEYGLANTENREA